MPHLAERFEHVVGVDVDLPALVLAAKRCWERGLFGRVTLAAAALEQQSFAPATFDAIKFTDVIEHVADPRAAVAQLAAALRERGVLFVLTPNKWSPWSPEPHVRLWGVQFMPARLADTYVRWRVGVRYRDVARLLSYRELMRVLDSPGCLDLLFIPLEDKHLNPGSARGRRLKRVFLTPPLSWLSRLARPIQPTLEVLAIKQSA